MIRLDGLDLCPVKRGRGRPRGPAKRDEARLGEVADLLVAGRGLKITTAIKRVLRPEDYGNAEPASAARRLYRKFRARQAFLLTQARERRRARIVQRELNHSWSLSREMDAAIGRASAYRTLAAVAAAHRRVATLRDRI